MTTVPLQELGIQEDEPEDRSTSMQPQMLPVTRYQQTVVLLSSFMAVFQTIGT
jgi:hypothetical protein